MPDGVTRSGFDPSFDERDFASHEPDNVCRASTTPTASASVATGDDSWATSSTPFLPIDHPASGTPLHKFRATGEVSRDCVNDCVSSQGLTGSGAAIDGAVALMIGGKIAGVAALLTEGTVTTLACYVACSDLESLAPKGQPAPVEVPDASVYSVAVP